MKLKFFLEQSKEKLSQSGEARIYLYISHEQARFKVTTKISVNPINWNQKKQEIKGNTQIIQQYNSYLQTLKDEVNSVYTSALNKVGKNERGEYERFPITAAWLKNQLSFITKYTTFETGPDGKRIPKVIHITMSLFSVYDLFMEDRQRIWNNNTYIGFKSLLETLTKIDKTYKLDFNTIDSNFLNAFIKYHAALKCTNSYTKKNLTMFITFMKWATESEYNKNLEFTKKKWKEDAKLMLKLPSRSANIVSLTIEEIEAIRKVKLDKEKLEQVRDIFLFGCYTGLRISDIEILESQHIKNGVLDIITVKDGKDLKKPLSKLALAIIDKYKDLPGDKALPVQRAFLSEYVREVAQKAGINTEVTVVSSVAGQKMKKESKPKYEVLRFHDSRVTYNTINELILKLPETICKELTGHSTGSEAHNRYIGTNGDMLTDAVNRFDALFKGTHKLRIA